ncbi:MAG TPA: sensor domain-containing diguanylate cyclase [Candidatus Omnitrophota bacterium]|nr:sensor domain-containing diguanylate cyclase [Candidatus Omnitrophota bacterium]HPT07677.1 sensor domain-containing diguanylate cyclase [Candidatus Omnitrophota bacterium]
MQTAEKNRYAKTALYGIVFFLGYFLLPLYFAAYHFISFKLLSLFYLINTLIVFYLLRSYFLKKYDLTIQIQDVQERINIANDAIDQEQKSSVSFDDKIRRYDSLKNIIERINQSLDLETLAETLCSISFSLIADEKGTCILYLVDKDTQSLSLYKTKKEDKKLVIKAKQGDIFDLWVSRHVSPLLVEDVKKDFRFDLEKIPHQEHRPISSVVIAPLISENKFLGIMRLDNPRAGFYTQDDLRFLMTICDQGAIAIENSELYQKTQDLAIHDGLTGLYTKGYFLDRLNEEVKRSNRRHVAISLYMIDIDYFKNYNDKFGHSAGDVVLRNMSMILTETLQDVNPVIGRFGGEEFCVILTGVDKEKSAHLAKNLCEAVERTKVILRRQETNVTVSIGVASFPQDANDADELILKADRAMYDAKQQGRNRVIVTK